MIREYQIVCEDAIIRVESKVHQLISEGWIPQGGVAICEYGKVNIRDGYTESVFTCAQAMVRHTPEVRCT